MKQFSLLIGFLLLSFVSEAQYTGTLPVTLNGVPSGATAVQWYKDGAAISGANAITYNATTTGNYYATFTDASTACTDDRTVSFVLLNSGSNITINGSTNNGTGSAYQWYNAGAAVSGAATANYTANTGGLYSLKYNNGTCEIETNKTYVFMLSSTSNPDPDTDGDGVANSMDIDDDNDGILDDVECGCAANGFTNGSFETPVLPPNDYLYTTTVPGWATTSPDGIIELQSYVGTPFEGNQYAELNATQPSALYQTFCVNGLGGTINWSVRHKGRFGVDVANVRIGTSLASTLASAPVQVMTDGSSTWGLYTGTYNVPVGVTSVIIAFDAVSSNGGAGQLYEGNLIDDVKMMFSNCGDTDNDGIANALDLDSDGDGCSDAFEAGATTNTTPNYQFTGAVGTNGLINSLETAADNGILNYTPTYTNATNPAIKTCPTCNAGTVAPVPR